MIAVDVRVGEVTGLMNLAIPSIFIKRLRNKFEQLQKVRKAHASEADHLIVADLLQDVGLISKHISMAEKSRLGHWLISNLAIF